jgi:ribosomal-protein-serine acetyltransferase
MPGRPIALPASLLEGVRAVNAVSVRRLTSADAGAFATHVAGDLERLGTYLPWPAETCYPAGAREWLAAYEEQREGRVLAAGAWSGEELLGGAVLFHHDPPGASVEIGCWVIRAAEGRGVASACCRALVRVARDDLRAERLEWRSAAANLASRRLAERLGFHHEGTLRSAYVLRGERLDIDVLSLVGAELDV